MNKLLEKYVEEIEYCDDESLALEEVNTCCRLTLKNGYQLIGTSRCLDPVDFDNELGKFYALEDALRYLSIIHGFLEQELLSKELKSGEEEENI